MAEAAERLEDAWSFLQALDQASGREMLWQNGVTIGKTLEWDIKKTRRVVGWLEHRGYLRITSPGALDVFQVALTQPGIECLENGRLPEASAFNTPSLLPGINIADVRGHVIVQTGTSHDVNLTHDTPTARVGEHTSTNNDNDRGLGPIDAVAILLGAAALTLFVFSLASLIGGTPLNLNLPEALNDFVKSLTGKLTAAGTGGASLLVWAWRRRTAGWQYLTSVVVLTLLLVALVLLVKSYLPAPPVTPTNTPTRTLSPTQTVSATRTDQSVADTPKGSLPIDPQNASILLKEGDELRKQSELDKAILKFELSYELNPKSSAPLVRIADIYREQRRYKEAEQTYEKALTIEPAAHNNFGLLLLEVGRNAEARTHFALAAASQPLSVFLFNQARAEARLGNKEAAIDLLESAMKSTDANFYREKAKADSSFETIREYPQFRSLVYGDRPG